MENPNEIQQTNIQPQQQEIKPQPEPQQQQETIQQPKIKQESEKSFLKEEAFENKGKKIKYAIIAIIFLFLLAIIVLAARYFMPTGL